MLSDDEEEKNTTKEIEDMITFDKAFTLDENNALTQKDTTVYKPITAIGDGLANKDEKMCLRVASEIENGLRETQSEDEKRHLSSSRSGDDERLDRPLGSKKYNEFAKMPSFNRNSQMRGTNAERSINTKRALTKSDTSNTRSSVPSGDVRNDVSYSGKMSKNFVPRHAESKWDLAPSGEKIIHKRYDAEPYPRQVPKKEPVQSGAFFISLKAYFLGEDVIKPGELCLRWSNGTSSKNWHWFVNYYDWRSPDKDLTNECARDCGFSLAILHSEKSLMTEKRVKAEIYDILDKNKDDAIYTIEFDKVYKWMSNETYRHRLYDYTKIGDKLGDIVVEDNTQPSGTSNLDTWKLCKALSTDGRCFFHNRVHNYKYDCARRDAYIVQQHWLLTNNMFIPSK